MAIRGLDFYQTPFYQLRGIVRVLLADPTTELSREVRGYGLTMGQLAYHVVDVLSSANWQRTGKKTGQPKPLAERLKDEARQAASMATLEAAPAVVEDWAEYLSQFAPPTDNEE